MRIQAGGDMELEYTHDDATRILTIRPTGTLRHSNREKFIDELDELRQKTREYGVLWILEELDVDEFSFTDWLATARVAQARNHTDSPVAFYTSKPKMFGTANMINAAMRDIRRGGCSTLLKRPKTGY